MLEQVIHDNGIITYQSQLLRDMGVIHAFTTRIGGVSKGPYASLNLGPLTKDPDTDFNTSIAENYRRLRRALGIERMPRVECQQVHGGEVWQPREQITKVGDAPCADAIVTERADHLLVVRTADCVPVLLASTDGGAVAAIHAGWRGVVAEIVPNTVEYLRDAGFGGFVAAIGPCISLEQFEVGDEVAQAFDAAVLGEAVQRDCWPKPHVDLARAVAIQLQQCDVDAIDTTDRCTYRDADEFFSHRRDKGVTGRMAAIIARPQA